MLCMVLQTNIVNQGLVALEHAFVKHFKIGLLASGESRFEPSPKTIQDFLKYVENQKKFHDR